jgi:nucleoside-diphosphate-sugar epimerase
MKIAVTGATGFIGSHLVETLVSRGHEVTCLARSPKKLVWISHLPVRVVYGDVCAPESLAEFTAGQDSVVHCAGLTKAAVMEEYVRVNVDGTVNLLAAIKKNAPRLRRFVYLSTLEAMGPSSASRPHVEDVEQHPLSMYGRSKSMAEKALRSFSDTLQMTVIRPPAAFGPRDRDIFAYFRLAARGFTPVIGYRNTISIVYVKNLAAGIALALERPFGSMRSYFLTDGPPLSWTGLSELIARAVGKRTMRITVPAFAVRMAGSVSGLYSAITHKAVLVSKDKIEAMKQEYWTASDQRARSELGYKPAYTTEQGIGETAEWYKREGWLK